MKLNCVLPFLFSLCFPILLLAQEGSFETCYLNLCEDGELTTLQLGSSDKIQVKSTVDGEPYGIISFTVTFVMSGKKMECTCREDSFTTRCLALRDKLAVDDQMVIRDVVFKDIRGGGKIRTAPELSITIVKPYKDE